MSCLQQLLQLGILIQVKQIDLDIRIMSTQDFNKKINQATKAIAALRKDIKYRQDEASRGQTTYSIDAQIRGQFSDLDNVLFELNKMVNNYQANPKDYNLNSKQVDKRKQQYDRLVGDKSSLKRTYDSFFQKKASQDINNMTGQPTFKQKYETKNMTAKQLADLKSKQQQQQQQAIDGLIDTVRNIKQGNKGINKELVQQDVLLNQLDSGIDQNIQRMGKTKRKMMKLLDKSSNCCLITTMIIQIVAIVCILVLWN